MTWTPSPSDDPRLESFWRWSGSGDLPLAKNPKSVCIVSYPDDEGVRLNNGRPGAAEGPARILHYLGRMVTQPKTPPLILLSNKFSHLRLSDRHQAAEEAVFEALNKNYRVISLGGGHDYGFPDASAFLRKFKGAKVLNMDAHLDVRPVLDHKLNSGTAFSRLIEKFGGKSLIEWGIQEHCNSSAQIAWAKSQGAKVLSHRQKCPPLKGRVGLSICLDAFEGIRGVSAPAMVGFSKQLGLDTVEHFAKSSPWMGLYESAPRYDQQTEDSSRFAALLAYRFLHR